MIHGNEFCLQYWNIHYTAHVSDHCSDSDTSSYQNRPSAVYNNPIPVITNKWTFIQYSTNKSCNPNNLQIINTDKLPSDKSAIVTIKMALFNVRSLLNKMFLITGNDPIQDNKWDCLFLTDMRPGSVVMDLLLSEAFPPNYHFSYSCRNGWQGGGAATILSSAFTFKDIHFDRFLSVTVVLLFQILLNYFQFF